MIENFNNKTKEYIMDGKRIKDNNLKEPSLIEFQNKFYNFKALLEENCIITLKKMKFDEKLIRTNSFEKIITNFLINPELKINK